MSDATARFSLPLLIPGQAQKEFNHNEALAWIDAVLHPAVEQAPAAVPPDAPLPRQCWIVAEGASGAWGGQEGKIAAWTEGGWRFVAPLPGMLAWSKAGGYWIHFDGTSWIDGALPVQSIRIAGQQVLGVRQPAVPSPSGGTTIDQEARVAIDQITAALMSHGLIG